MRRLYSIPQAQAYLEHQIGRDALYAIAQLNLVPVVRVGRGKILFPISSLELIASGQVDLSVIQARSTRHRTNRY